MSRARAQRCAMVAAATLLLATGCTDERQSPGDDRAEQGGGPSGPLTTSLSGGGNSVLPPASAPATWTATFGSLLVCSPEPVTLSEIEPHVLRGQAVSVDFSVRTVPDAREREGPGLAWAPLGTATRTPSQLADAGKLRYGTLVEARGAEVDQSCGTGSDGSFTEILTTVTADARGAWIDGLDVGYRSGGETYSLLVDWSYVACGTATQDPEAC